jgi:hypothetical protein
MYHLATVFPPVRRIRLPLTRDQLMLLMAAVNELFLSVDIYMAHSISGSIKTYEWIPIVFGAVGGVLLLVAGVIAFRSRSLATVMANLVFVGSIIVGLMGAYFHLRRTILLSTPVSSQTEAVNALIWAPPFIGPFFFSLVGILGISAAWVESPPDSGRLKLLGNRTIQMPYSKTRAYFFIVSIGIVATLISSVLDHARVNLENPWVWLPLTVGIFSTVVAAALGAIRSPTRADLVIYTVAMLMLIVTGLVGAVLHISANLSAQGTIVIERFVRGSPILAPTVFANFGLIGLLVLLDPAEEKTAEE